MINLILKILFHIIGLGAASGLFYNNNTLLVIGDNSGYLYEYNIAENELKRHELIDDAKENIAKKKKIDYESMAVVDEEVYVFGSGSGKNRSKLMVLNIEKYDTVYTTEIANLYEAMKSIGKISTNEFNIEGVIFDGKNWLFFNRGKGVSNRNVIFKVTGKNLTGDPEIECKDIKLPEINGFRSGFSDAVLIEDKIYFLSTAENTDAKSSEDRNMGTILGCINKPTMQIDFTQEISDHKKFEGITLYKNTKDEIEFLLCEDNDTEVLESDIYNLTLKK